MVHVKSLSVYLCPPLFLAHRFLITNYLKKHPKGLTEQSEDGTCGCRGPKDLDSVQPFLSPFPALINSYKIVAPELNQHFHYSQT